MLATAGFFLSHSRSPKPVAGERKREPREERESERERGRKVGGEENRRENERRGRPCMHGDCMRKNINNTTTLRPTAGDGWLDGYVV